MDTVEKPSRDWIGIDMTQLAISRITNRLPGSSGSRLKFITGPPAPLPCSHRQSGKERSQAGRGETTQLVRIIGKTGLPTRAFALSRVLLAPGNGGQQ